MAFRCFTAVTNRTIKGTAEVAEINGEIISQRDFAVQYQRAVERYREMLKGSLTPEMIKGLNLKGNLIEEMIQKKLVLQEARSLGLTASDDELAVPLAKCRSFKSPAVSTKNAICKFFKPIACCRRNSKRNNAIS